MNHVFSSRLTELRLKAGLSQKQLAITLHVSASTFSNYENGIYLPPLNKVYILARELDCSLDYLCGLSTVNVPSRHWERPLNEHMNFFRLVKLLISLKDKELLELLRYAEYLKYKQKNDSYLPEPQISLVADEP